MAVAKALGQGGIGHKNPRVTCATSSIHLEIEV